MNETDTRRKLIDPKLKEAGWEEVANSEILTEQSAYLLAPGRITKNKSSKPKKADYVLKYKGQRLAVIEAKNDDKSVYEGVDQAKLYAQLLNIRYAYATNGKQIYFIDMGITDRDGNIIGYKEKFIDSFHSPMELWKMTFPNENTWRDKFRAQKFYTTEKRKPRYYQENAVNAVLDAVANKQNRILLTMATGTGKTYTAFQICWKLYQTKWKANGANNYPKILFIADRTTLADQAKLDFRDFDEDIMERISPKTLNKKAKSSNQGKIVPKSRSIYFTIFQTMMTEDSSGKPCYMQYEPDFFDFIIIDECHRGGANDEGEWRALMEYFSPAYQLGMTATPKKKENSNTYKYFGEAVYAYSLKQGIDDGYLTPYKVKISSSNIDSYKFKIGDKVIQGNLDANKTYEQKDFENKVIYIRERDEHRVKELLENIEDNEKTIVFCEDQKHAMEICCMINSQAQKGPYYCKRVTSDDGDDGELYLADFKDNDKTMPTILTSSDKLTTGIDAKNVRNIVLMRSIKNIIEFKQIIGRGTRIFSNKYFFTIIDFTNATNLFQDPDWDGDPICPICGNWPCTCTKEPKVCKKCGKSPCECPKEPPVHCPVCGNLPCTCPGGGGHKKKTAVVELSKRRVNSLHTEWEERFQIGDDLVTLEEFVKILFGKLPKFFKTKKDLQMQWKQPETRQALLDQLEQEGFAEDKLRMAQRLLKYSKCDLYDVLEFLAFKTTPIERQKRVELVNQQYIKAYPQAQREFMDFIMVKYVNNGVEELSMENLVKFLEQKYGSIQDAKDELGLELIEIRDLYLNLQEYIYSVA